MYFTIGETGLYNHEPIALNVGEFGNNGYGGQGYYKNNYREIHITKAYNNSPTMELYIFGFDEINPSVSITYTYQPAYGGDTKYPFWVDNRYSGYLGDSKSQQFPSSKSGTLITDFGGMNAPAIKKYNGIYTFKIIYKGKTYTSILHLKLSNIDP
ncbi:hypothetical protein I7U11_001688 [Campylobacter coli]|nr:hypothetical protein [Campylobacter coli]